MPAYCEPCPGKRNATRGVRRRHARDDARMCRAVEPRVDAAQRARRRPHPTRVIRCAKCARPKFAVAQRSSSVPSSPSVHARSTSRYRSAIVRNACASRAESASTCSGRVEQRVRRRWRRRVGSGAASRMTCAFVPLKPNELTAAMRRPFASGNGIARRRHDDRQIRPNRCADSASRSADAAESPRDAARAPP